MSQTPSQPNRVAVSGDARSRRSFLAVTAGVVAGTALPSMSASAARARAGRSPRAAAKPLIVSTWPFGRAANDKAFATLQAGGGLLDAIVEGITVTENDLTNHSVGRAGTPNAEGVVSLDACIMDGRTHKCGSVAAVEGILPVIKLARTVMETTRHVMLVGDGARRFALQHGFQSVEMPTPDERAQWEQWKAKQAAGGSGAPPLDSHDTIAMVVLGADGNLAGGCSTSGLAYKLAGRVGDSPIIGSGLYVDNDVGAAGATGVGENIMRFCGSFQIVELMRAGAHPHEACVETIRRIQKKHESGKDLAINFLAIDKKGRFGAAGTGEGFPFSVTYPGFSQVLPSDAVPHRG
jgi:N4-(beta-N-acetylglucosaminyl)-L-asparaginase